MLISYNSRSGKCNNHLANNIRWSNYCRNNQDDYKSIFPVCPQKFRSKQANFGKEKNDKGKLKHNTCTQNKRNNIINIIAYSKCICDQADQVYKMRRN